MSDSITPTPLTVDAGGRVGAQFSGSVAATNFQLGAIESPYETPFTKGFIKWVDAAGALAAWIAGAKSLPEFGIGSHVAVGYGTPVAGGANEVVLLESSGKSSFLKLASAFAGSAPFDNRSINWGSTALRWPGASSASETKEVAHGLPRPAAAVIASASPGLGAFVEAQPSGAEKVKLRGQDPFGAPVAGTEIVVYWIAIG